MISFLQDTIKEVVGNLPIIARIQLPIPLVVIEVTGSRRRNAGNENSGRRERSLYEIADALELWNIKKRHPGVQWLCSSVDRDSGDDIMKILQWVGSLYNSFLTIRTD